MRHDFPRAPLLARAAAAAAFLPRRLTSRWRRLPSFLILGAQRCGTTSLARFLERHPGVFVARAKELHYFDLAFDRGTGWYRAHFPLAGACAAGEATPYYLFHPCVPERVRAVVPEAKLIALLRNPVERAYSHYHHERRGGYEDAPTFAEALAREPARLAGEEAKLIRGEVGFCTAHNHFSYLARGEYARQLGRWLAHFPRGQLLVVRSESLFEDPGTELGRVLRFLGVEPVGIGALPRYNEARNPPMEPPLRERLIDHFRPHDRALRELLGSDFGWEG